MRICLVNPFYDKAAASALEVAGKYRHVEALASALARRKHEVVVVQAFHREGIEYRNSAEFRYAKAPYRPVARLCGGKLGLDLLASGNLTALLKTIGDVQPDAVHMNGLTLIQPLSRISAWCAKVGCPLTVTYHGGTPRLEPWLLRTQHRMLSSCQGVFFTTRFHARAWLAAGLLKEEQVVPCMEVSSTFSPSQRARARSRTGMKGNPVFAWNARLHPIKDPLTGLRGFSRIRRAWPDARLYMIYYTNELHAQVLDAVASDPNLADAVEMRGTIQPREVEDFLNSADFLIQCSLQEVAGYSVLEAMSCGVIPIVTDIPSFRAMTDGGRLGVLFPIGDHDLMAERTLTLDPAEIMARSSSVREFFVESLSYDSIAKTYERALRRAQHRVLWSNDISMP